MKHMFRISLCLSPLLGLSTLGLPLALSACTDDPDSLGAATGQIGAETPVVKFDVYHRPFPEIPLPNDFATRYDATSPTRRRLNASILVGATEWEKATRAELDKLSGWGTLAPISVGFTAPIDPEVIIARHWKDNYAFDDDAVFVIDVSPGSPDLCKAVPLDMGQGNYPQVLENKDQFDADPRADLETIVFEEVEEDVNGNGLLDPGEDTDMDGVLDHPNTRDGKVGSERLEFYERETNTLILKPIVPMREKTTYAVVLTKRLTSPSGEPVHSPFANVNHTSQTDALAPLPGCLSRYGLTTSDLAFTWTFTTQSITDDYRTVRDGLYGVGPMAHLASDFPATVTRLRDVRDGDGETNTQLVPNDQLAPLLNQVFGLTSDSEAERQMFAEQLGFIDFVVSGEFRSPQFFRREDAHGQRLPLYQQVWDLAAPPRAEALPFWLFVPKNRTGPAPVAIFVHGHGGSKFDALPFAGIMAGYGIATLGFEAPGHGIQLDQEQLGLLQLLFSGFGVEGLADALLTGRALDWNNDGKRDSGDDYWTSYVFHTRDNVRQTMVDLMQIVRTLRGFDGTARWAWDPAKTGTAGLAGDFDGDGVVDVGGAAPLTVLGGSLGGINGSVAAGVEPALDAVVAIVPGGVLGEIGTRSTLGGIRNAMMLRVLSPIFFSRDNKLMVRVNDGHTENVALTLADLPALTPKDTVVLTNLKTGEHRCGAVQPSGVFRVTVSVDAGDPLRLDVFSGPLAPAVPEGCVVPDDVEPIVTIDRLGYAVTYAGVTRQAGTRLSALTDGFGQRRASPDLRRLLGLSQIALESADPANWAPYWNGSRTMTYGTGETVRTQVMVMPSIGDPGVPVAMGIALARSAGMIGYAEDDTRYGKSQNQVLIDTWAIEGIPRTKRYTDAAGRGVLMDLEHLASIVPVDDGLDVPRLDPPLRLMHEDAETGLWSGFMIPMFKPEGMHGFVAPDASKPFDLGAYLLNQIGRFLATGGAEFTWDKCQATWSCAWIPEPE